MPVKLRYPYAVSWVVTFVAVVAVLAIPSVSHAQISSTGGFSTDTTDPAVPAPVPAPAGSAATIDASGRAVAPADAPAKVKQIIAAGNKIASKPYVYGGGHRRWRDRGYDCSGSVSYALRGAKLLTSPLASGDFIGWGEAGEGSWVTIYTKSSHMYMVVAGLRFDTSARKGNRGSRWSATMRPAQSYKVRHPVGL